ncbi:MAG: ABC transporter permease, partial [Clostridiales bacterium]
MKLIKYIIRRILWLIPVIIGVTIIAFLVTRILPGDPIQLLLGDNISDQIKQMYIEKWGLDQPLYIQYFYYLRDLLHGDLGTSYLTNNAVAFDLMKRLPATLELIIMAMILSVVIGITAGIVAAINRNNIFDHITRVFVLIGTILPPFWLGLLLIYFFFFLAGV